MSVRELANLQSGAPSTAGGDGELKMTKEWPRIRSRQVLTVSPWMEIIAREVEFSPEQPVETYHAVAQQDYIAIVARTPDGRIPIVRQYRPAVEMFTWELPAGLVESGEQPAECARRELLEETGYAARTIYPLGTASPCTGRLSNRVHSFFVETMDQVSNFRPEPGMVVTAMTPTELVALINSGEFIQQMHLGALLLTQLHGLMQLPR
jgi:ADP-ribose pyrophosphatase